MLEKAGFDLECIEGGRRSEPFAATSPKMFVRAVLQHTSSDQRTTDAVGVSDKSPDQPRARPGD